MTLLDVASVALVVILGFVEAKRGAPTAAVDLGLALLAVSVARSLTGTGLLSSVTAGSAFCIWYVALLVLGGFVGWFFDNHTKWDIGAYDRPVGGVCGVVVGFVVAHGMFHAAHTLGGSAEHMAQISAMNPEVYDLKTLRAMGDMLTNLGSGPTITDQVQKTVDGK
jgi:hypothetical protein